MLGASHKLETRSEDTFLIPTPRTAGLFTSVVMEIRWDKSSRQGRFI